jgi:hypothetical protein
MGHLINNSAPSDILGDGMLFVGNASCAELHGAEYDMVVNCTANLPFASPGSPQVQVRIPVDDCPEDSLPLFIALRDTTVLRDMEDVMARGGRVLVHCMAGAQRSAAVAACFLVARRGLDPEAAIHRVRSARPAAFFFGIVNLRAAIERAVELIDPTPPTPLCDPTPPFDPTPPCDPIPP